MKKNYIVYFELNDHKFNAKVKADNPFDAHRQIEKKIKIIKIDEIPGDPFESLFKIFKGK